MIYLLCFILFGVGIYGLLVKKNIIKLIMSMMISSYAIHIFLIATGFIWHGRTPVLNMARQSNDIVMVDPLPQALVLCLIIVSAAFISLLCVAAIRLYQKFGTFDVTKMREKIRY